MPLAAGGPRTSLQLAARRMNNQAGENFKAATENFKAAGESSRAEWERAQKDNPYYLAHRIDMLDSSVKDMGNRIDKKVMDLEIKMDKQFTDLGYNVTDLKNDMDKLQPMVVFVTALQSFATGVLNGVGIMSVPACTHVVLHFAVMPPCFNHLVVGLARSAVETMRSSMSDITQLFHKTPSDVTCTTEAAASDSTRNEKKRRPSLPFVTPVASALPRFNSQSLQRVSFPPAS
ncbi:hypothetical protein JKP88DRAFT_255659 [Tribonema minus]|uniref:Uncharacterized protein n=1 Tax=Tribonema minus TaxID=303371 RepID=A0A836CFF7_9STRA|nr:hypothetical protein JKP88DRAFT_255659 [Tribonema minus]